jgi:hypothetical protein
MKIKTAFATTVKQQPEKNNNNKQL